MQEDATRYILSPHIYLAIFSDRGMDIVSFSKGTVFTALEMLAQKGDP